MIFSCILFSWVNFFFFLSHPLRAEYTDKAALSVGLGREVGLGGAAAALGDLLCLLAVSDQQDGDSLPPNSSSGGSGGGRAIDGPHFFEDRSALIGSLGPKAVQMVSVHGRLPSRGNQKNGYGGEAMHTNAAPADTAALPGPRFTLAKLRSVLALPARLSARRRCPPFELASANRASQALIRCSSSLRASSSAALLRDEGEKSGAHVSPKSWVVTPQLTPAAGNSVDDNSSSRSGASTTEVLHFSWPIARLPPGAFYLASVKSPAEQPQRSQPRVIYARKSTDSIVDLAAPLGPTVEEQLRRAAAEAAAASAMAEAEAAAVASAATAAAIASEAKSESTTTTTTSETQQWNQHVEIVVTGTAAGLPSPRVPANNSHNNSGSSTDSSGSSSSSGSTGSDSGVVFARNAFDALNLHRLVYGENCIDALTPKELSAMVRLGPLLYTDGINFHFSSVEFCSGVYTSCVS